MNDAEAWQLLRQLGPDQNTLDCGFNLRFTNGAINSDINIYNQLNELIYQKFSMHFETPYPFNTTPFILSKTTFYRHEYGDQFMNSFGNRLGLTCPADKLNCLRSVVMDPYVTHTADGNYFVEIIKLTRQHVSEIVKENFE